MDVKQGNNDATVVMASVDAKYWMTSYHDVLSPLKLHELKIPSTLNSGMFEYGAQQHEINESVPSESPWQLQIEAGIRSLDLRIYQAEAGEWVFHYSTLPSEHSVQSLIDWCNAYYGAADATINNEIIIFNISDCYSVNDDFDYVALKNFFVNGLRSTSLIPSSATLSSLAEIHQDHPGKNIILSWDRCIDDNLIWPYRLQALITAVLPAREGQKTIAQMYLIHNATTECTSKLFVANACLPAVSHKQEHTCSTLDHDLIQTCINANIEKAPPVAPVIAWGTYDFPSRILFLTFRAHFKTSQYQLNVNDGSKFIIYPHQSANGFDQIELPLAPDETYLLSIQSIDAKGAVSQSTLINFDTVTPEPISGPGEPSGQDGPEIKIILDNGDNCFMVYLWPTANSIYDYLLGYVFLSKDINGGIATAPALFKQKINTSATGFITPVLESNERYTVAVVGVFKNLERTKATWEEI